MEGAKNAGNIAGNGSDARAAAPSSQMSACSSITLDGTCLCVGDCCCTQILNVQKPKDVAHVTPRPDVAEALLDDNIAVLKTPRLEGCCLCIGRCCCLSIQEAYPSHEEVSSPAQYTQDSSSGSSKCVPSFSPHVADVQAFGVPHIKSNSDRSSADALA